MENSTATKTVNEFKLELGRLLGNNFYGLSFSDSTYIVFIKSKTPKHVLEQMPTEFDGSPVKVIKSVPIMPLIA